MLSPHISVQIIDLHDTREAKIMRFMTGFGENTENYILSNQDNDNLINEEKQARKIGINSVPSFIFNKAFVVNGAQPKENFIRIINSLNNYD